MYDKRYTPRRNFRVDEDMLRRVVENKCATSNKNGYDAREACESCETCEEQALCEIYGEMPSSLAMVCCPIQSFCELYSEEKGFRRGTIFVQLDKPFHAGGNVKSRGGNVNGCK